MADLGALVVSLEANIANFTRDMNKASAQTEAAMGKINKAVDLVKGGLAALGIGATVGALAELIRGSIDAADNLRDMSQKTGIAVETLNGLGFAAGQAGGSLESIVAAAGKLNKSLVEAGGGNKDTAEAFTKMGISVRDAEGHLKSADVVMAEVADKFKDYADGPEKTAIALRIFGKAGADMIPLLNDGGDALRENIAYAKEYSGVTQELADASDNFNDTMGKLTVQQKSFTNAMTAAVMPVLQAVADELLSGAEKSNKFALAGNVLRTVFETIIVIGSEVAFTFKGIGTEIGGMSAQVAALAHGDFKGFTAISEAMKEDAERARKEHDEFIKKVLDRTPPPVEAPAVDPEKDKPKSRAPVLRAKGDDPAKAILDGQLKTLEDAYAKERAAADFHAKKVQELRNQDLISLADYNKDVDVENKKAIAASDKFYDDEIRAIQKARSVAVKETERATLTNQLNEKIAAKERARTSLQNDATLQTMKLSSAQSELNKNMKEWVIQQDLAADQFRFEISLFGRSALEVAKLTAARRIDLDVQEQIRRAQKDSVTPIDRAPYLAAAAEAKAKINALYDQQDAQQGDPWARMTEAVRQYGEAASDVGGQVGNAMASGLQNAEDAFVSFATTGKLSFSSLAKSIIADLARIQAKQAVSGIASFLGSAVSAYFNGPSASLGDFKLDPGTVNVDTSSFGDLSFLDNLPHRAMGGPVLGGTSYLVGERGPEIFKPAGAGTIIPNHQIGGGASGIQINTEINISDSGASSTTNGSGDTGRALAEMINAKVKEVIVREKRQGGLLWSR